MNTKYSGTLESSRLDGKLAFTKDIFDNTNQKSQEQVNTDIKKDIVDNKKTLDDEIKRAVDKDNTLSTAITTEKNRASDAELAIGNAINDEINRASKAETYIFNKQKGDVDALQLDITNINHTITDNKIASDKNSTKNASDIINEVNRATTEEFNIQKQIDNITVEPITYEEVVAKGLNDLYDKITSIGIQTPIVRGLVDWFDVRDINYYDKLWYSRLSSNVVHLDNINITPIYKEDAITTLEPVLYNIANKMIIGKNYNSYRTICLLLGLNYKSIYRGVLFSIKTPNTHVDISINNNNYVSLDTYNSSNSLVNSTPLYQLNDTILNLNLSRNLNMLYIYNGSTKLDTVDIQNLDPASTPRNTTLYTGNWDDVTLKSILVYNKVLSDSELNYNSKYFDSREYALINRIGVNSDIIPNVGKLYNDLSTIKNLIASAVGVDNNKLIMINTDVGNTMYYGNTNTTSKNLIYGGPFDNTEKFVNDGVTPNENNVEEIINLPTNVGRTDFTRYISNCTHLTYINFSNLNTNSMTIAKQMLMGCKALSEIDVRNINMSKVTDASYMLSEVAAKSIIGLDKWDMSKCLTIEGIFKDTYIRNILNYQSWILTSCNILDSVFENFANSDDVDISEWVALNITSIIRMFKNNKAKFIKVTNLNISKCTSCLEVFYGCENITSIDLSGLNTTLVTDFSYMISECSKLLTLVLPFNTANAVNMTGMFKNNSALYSVDISSFNTAKLTNVTDLFSGCYSLYTLKWSSLFNLANCVSAGGMFDYCNSLNVLNLSYINTVSMTTLPTFKNCVNLYMFIVSANYFNSSVSTYDFSELINWSDSTSINTLVSVLPNVTNKVLKLSTVTKSVLTDAQKAIISNKGWTLN